MIVFMGTAFRTDTDISQKKTGGGGEKELQAWQAPPDAPATSEGTQFARGDDVTFGPGSNGNASWDQFTTNEKLFGVKATYDEDAYTTKLDRSAPEYKERAREAQKIADEILGVRYQCFFIYHSDFPLRLLQTTHTSQRRGTRLMMTAVSMRKTSL